MAKRTRARVVAALLLLVTLAFALCGGATHLASALEGLGSQDGSASQVRATLSAEESDAIVAAAAQARDAQPKQADVSLDLAGGSLSGLPQGGWSQATESDTWAKTLDVGASIELGTPERRGYTFLGWDVDGDGVSDGPSGGGAFTYSITGDQTLTALWEKADFNVTFVVPGGDPRGEISVPYEATLWTDGDEEPWEDAGVVWSGNTGGESTATMTISYGGNEYQGVKVTRTSLPGAAGGYWYSFSLGTGADVADFFAFGPEVTSGNDNEEFSHWKKTQGGEGYQVTEDTVFTAQFVQKASYVINVHYRTASEGTTVAPSKTVVLQKGEEGSASGKLSVEFEVPTVEHYELSSSNDLVAYTADGMPVTSGVEFAGPDAGGMYSASIDVSEVFDTEAEQTNYLSIVVRYEPEQVSYQVEYYLQNVEQSDYVLESTSGLETVSYGSVIPVQAKSFDGFKVSASSRLALSNGVVLSEENATGGGDIAWDEASKTFTIRINYDRASYFVYPLLDSAQLTLDVKKVVYGGKVTSQLGGNSPEKQGYTFDGWTWYRLDDKGELQEEVDKDGKPIDYLDGSVPMPAYDLYAVANWTPAKSKFRVVLWLEDADTPSYSNVYQADVDNADVLSDEELTVSLSGDELTVLKGGEGGGVIYSSSQLLNDYVSSAYEGKTGFSKEAYAQFFSYNMERTQTSPGNIALAQIAGGSGSDAEGQLGASFTAVVEPDGTTSINVYYSRNLYTVEMVLSRRDGTTTQVATQTSGAFGTSEWGNYGGSLPVVNNPQLHEIKVSQTAGWADGTTVTAYGSGDASLYENNNENRYPVARFGTKTISSGGKAYSCQVYQITAKFEATIEDFWPTVDRLGLSQNNDNVQKYISLGSDGDSYYRRVLTNGGNPNILNIYGTMDEDIVLSSKGTNSYHAVPEDGTGGVAHQMVAYWHKGPYEYRYYFLKEVLDTSVQPDGLEVFDASTADKPSSGGGYTDGELVAYNGKVYVFESDFSMQYSTNNKAGQNQPMLKGFDSSGKLYSGNGTTGYGGNIYFFYDRETYSLNLKNVGEDYTLPEGAWEQRGSWTGEGSSQTLFQLGWEKGKDGKVLLRYGASLAPLDDPAFMSYLNDEGGLSYPVVLAGENQPYFHGWALNQALSIPADFSKGSSLFSVEKNVTLYVDWSTPRYTTTYVLNGGAWQEDANKIGYTLVLAEMKTSLGSDDEKNVFIAYKHQADKSEAETTPLYWYVQSQSEDRLYIDTLYETTLSDVMTWNDATNHWMLKDGLTIDDLRDMSKESEKSSLTGQYFCYMGSAGGDESHSHRYYVSINHYLEEVLERPADPVRNGYSFAGWFYFGDVPEGAQKVYLEDEFSDTGESVDAYRNGYVYLNEVDDAYLIHQDDDGRLFYYPEQVGYRMSFEHGASVVESSRLVYAAWEPNGDVGFTTLHLVKASELGGVSSLGGKSTDSLESVFLTVDGMKTEYKVLEEESRSVYNGQAVVAQAKKSYVDNSSKVWLPDDSSRQVSTTDATQTAAVSSDGQAAGNEIALGSDAGSYRIENEDGTYTYYAYFVYQKTDRIQYNVYSINLSLAVANGALDTFESTFDRTNPPGLDESFVISCEERQYTLGDNDNNPEVTVSAPDQNGYTVYRDTVQTLQLATNASSNNVYFYYVEGEATNRYSITYHVMHDGSYETGWTATISNIPAATGEIIRESQLMSLYDSLTNTAYLVDGYSAYGPDTNEGRLFKRYSGMTITLKEGADGEERSFTVGDVTKSQQLSQEEALAFNDGTAYDGHNPDNEVLLVSYGDGGNANIDVYLKLAQLTINKVDWENNPLSGCTFELTRMVLSNDSTPAGTEAYLYDADGDGTPEQYVQDLGSDGKPVTYSAVSDSLGRAVFYNLNADDGHVYLLREVAWPSGYLPLKEPVFVTVPKTVNGETSYAVTYTVRNNGVATLPSAGVLGGVYGPMLVGGACAAVALTAMAARALRPSGRDRQSRRGRRGRR